MTVAREDELWWKLRAVDFTEVQTEVLLDVILRRTPAAKPVLHAIAPPSPVRLVSRASVQSDITVGEIPPTWRTIQLCIVGAALLVALIKLLAVLN